jgi:2-keto-4-pentenoate hydratase
MTRGKQAERIAEIAEEAFAILGTGRQVAPFSARYSAFDLAAAYKVAAQVRGMRRARGENAIGRKIGFTNRAVWGGYGISAPIWNYMFDSTVKDLKAANETFALVGLPEPRIEPEIVLHMRETAGRAARSIPPCAFPRIHARHRPDCGMATGCLSSRSPAAVGGPLPPQLRLHPSD